LNTRRFGLTIFFILLTLSIGLISVNSTLTLKAQNSALTQDGNGVAVQDIEQLHSSNQDDQVVSGDSSILSGNNLICQDQESSNGVLEQICNSGVNNPNNDELIMMFSTSVRSPHYPITIETFALDGQPLDKIQTEIIGNGESFQVPINKQTSTMKIMIFNVGSPSFVYGFLTVLDKDSQMGTKRMNCSDSKDDRSAQCEVNGLLNTKPILGVVHIEER
jgi:hypothetical protein